MKTLVLLTSALIATGAWGQTSKELDITMSIVDENDSPSVVINRIALPPARSSYLAPGIVPSGSVVEDTLDNMQNTLQQTSDKILDSASEVISGVINDAISSGRIQDLPGDIIDKLPDDALDDLISLPGDDLPLIDDLIDDLTDLPATSNIPESVQDGLELRTAPEFDSGLDSALDHLENSNDLEVETSLPTIEPVIPEIPTELDMLDSQPLPFETNDLNLDPAPTGSDLLDNIPQPLIP